MEEGVQAWIVARFLIRGTFPSGVPGLKEEAMRTAETAQATGLKANGGPVSATATVMPKSEHDVGLRMGRRAGWVFKGGRDDGIQLQGIGPPKRG